MQMQKYIQNKTQNLMHNLDTKVGAKKYAIFDANLDEKEDRNLDAKVEENMDTTVGEKHGTNCGTTKVDVMIDAKKEES